MYPGTQEAMASLRTPIKTKDCSTGLSSYILRENLPAETNTAQLGLAQLEGMSFAPWWDYYDPCLNAVNNNNNNNK